MARMKLLQLAHARSGDKGDTANVGLIAYKPEYYPLLVEQVTAERVKEHFKGICLGDVERFEVPNLHALNFLLHESLDGGAIGQSGNRAKSPTSPCEVRSSLRLSKGGGASFGKAS